MPRTADDAAKTPAERMRNYRQRQRRQWRSIRIEIFPDFVVLLPRPGEWMIWLRRVLGVTLLVTAVWLTSVLFAQVGGPAALSVAACLAALPILLWARQRLESFAQAGALISIVIVVVLAFVSPSYFQARATDDHAASSDGIWRPFDAGHIQQLVREGRVVFVEVTADWCITCQVNNRLVLDRAPVLSRLARGDVVAMRADWTRPSDQIAAYLASFGRYGIPFSVVYGPQTPDGLPLPEILTSDAVIVALKTAVGDGGNAKQLDIGIVEDSAHLDRVIGDIGIKR
jgi:suppressor for copper-sensitivity B